MYAASKPHSFVGIPEARLILRLADQATPAALGELQRMAITLGAATMNTDAANVVSRMVRIAQDAIRIHA
jgi:hypothetical protein